MIALLLYAVYRSMRPTFDTLIVSRCPTLVKFIEASDITKVQAPSLKGTTMPDGSIHQKYTIIFKYR